MEFQLIYFRSWKMMLWKCCIQYASKFGKLSSGHRTGKRVFSFQSQRKAMPKNAQTTAELHSAQASKVMLKILQARIQQYMNQELPDVQTGFRKGRGTRDQTANIHWIIEKAREFQRNIYFCFIDYSTFYFIWLCASQQTLENSAVAIRLEKISFHFNPKERQCQRKFRLPHNSIHLTC